MFQNIKADIIYYNTNTDFELEFNLCGCCRMRLLNDKCSTPKTLIHSLARAVSRSKIIMIVAPLFSEQNVTEIVAQAIGTTTSIADNETYGILSNDDIKIITGSTPLVTTDGIFGGYIIESGPQTMILLTDNKNVRKNIMKTLIHPYIEEMYSLEYGEKNNEDISEEAAEKPLETEEISGTQETVQSEISEDEEEMLSEFQPIIEDETEFNENEQEDQHISDEDIALAQEMLLDEDKDDPETINEEYDESYDDLFIESTKLDRRSVERFTAEYAYSQNTEHDFLTDGNFEEKSDSKLNIWLLIISILLLLTLAVLCYCIFVVPSQSGVSPVSYLQEVYSTMFK